MTKRQRPPRPPGWAELARLLASSYIGAGGAAVDPDTSMLFERIAEQLKALADPTRLAILHLLQKGERRVSDILAEVGGSQANVSKHLGVLRQAGFVSCRREGVNIYYSIADPAVFAICRAVCDGIERSSEREREALARARARWER